MKPNMLKKGDIVTVIGRRWFQKLHGNTYHSVTILVNGEEVIYIPKRYGFGNQYLKTARDWLEKNDYIEPKQYSYGAKEAGWNVAERTGFTWSEHVTDVQRKKDL